jgi:hypothetical protein
MAPRFSVLLPTRNRSKLLRLAIASALAQTEPDLELLVVGDGCTDDSAGVCASFGDSRIRWFDLPKAFGFGYANRNVALRQSTGAFIAFIADDDLLLPDHLARVAAALDESGAEWAYSRPLWVTADGLVVPFAGNLLNTDELERFLTVGNHIPATCVMYRRDCLERYGYWPEDVPRAGDWRYWIRIIEGGKRRNLAYLPTPTALHFNADWKTTADSQMGQVVAAREIAKDAAWWPASMKVAMTENVPEQETFAGLMTAGGYADKLRSDLSRVVERLAWMQLSETPAVLARERAGMVEDATRLRAELAHTTDELTAMRNRLTAEVQSAARRIADLEAQLGVVLTSHSWRVTAPLRALSRALRHRGK